MILDVKLVEEKPTCTQFERINGYINICLSISVVNVMFYYINYLSFFDLNP